MSASGSLSAATQSPLIRKRPRAGVAVGVVLSLVFAAATAAVVLAEYTAVPDSAFARGEPAPITVRKGPFVRYPGAELGTHFTGGALVAARGEELSGAAADLAMAVRTKGPRGAIGFVVFAIGLLLLGTLFCANLRTSHRGKLLRTTATLMALVLGFAIAAKALLLLTPMSVFLLPVGALGVTAARAVDQNTGISTALLCALTAGLLTPFDPGVVAVLLVQGLTAALIIGRRPRPGRVRVLFAGVAAGAAAAAVYALYYYITFGVPPLAELDAPLRSSLLAAAAGGVLSGVLAVPLLPAMQLMLGEVTNARLVALSDFSQPLLKQIADNAPGTWQHSLAMANMAETAANEIGANGRLVRTGAYYHDLGKSLQPKYFIENLGGGENSPHESLRPEVSCDAIFAHVTEGVRVARQHGIPERIIDFIHMHHGDGRLEYFWHKCEEEGNDRGLTEAHFRYPGVKPQSRETAILAICDAVEAASRTLRQPTEDSIRDLVQRIVYGKLDLGQLDESGLTMADLRKVSASLIETIKHAHHGRIEYPWQREQREAEAGAETVLARPTAAGAATADADDGDEPPTERSVARFAAPPLDSLDRPQREMPMPPRARSATESPFDDDDPSASASLTASPADSRSDVVASSERPAEVAPANPPLPPSAAPPAIDTVPLTKPDKPGAPPRPRPQISVVTDPPPSKLKKPAQRRPVIAELPAKPPGAPDSRTDEAAAVARLLSARRRAGPPPPPGALAKPDRPASLMPAAGRTAADDGDEGDEGEVIELFAGEPPASRRTLAPDLPMRPPEPPRHTLPLDGPGQKPGPRQQPGPNALSDWRDAFAVADRVPSDDDETVDMPVPDPRKRPQRQTSDLLKAAVDLESVLEPGASASRSRPHTGVVMPGELVIGPPPETHPERADRPSEELPGPPPIADPTVEVKLPIPREGIRPSKRQTSEHPIVIPPEAYPDDTSPSVALPESVDDDYDDI